MNAKQLLEHLKELEKLRYPLEMFPVSVETGEDHFQPDFVSIEGGEFRFSSEFTYNFRDL